MSTKLAVVLVNAADTLVISAFLGLIEVAIYNNYYYIIKVKINKVLGSARKITKIFKKIFTYQRMAYISCSNEMP